MKILIALLFTTIVLISSAGHGAVAQESEDPQETADVQETGETQEAGEAQEKKPDEPVEWTERYDRMFLERTPILDDYAPDVSAFNENGEAFELSALQGKYTVIVFGCLT